MMMRARKGQSAIEFVALFTFMLIVFFAFFMAVQSRVADMTQSNDLQYLYELNDIVMTEIELAQRVFADYERNFTIRTLATSNDLSMEMGDELELTSRYNDVEYVNFLPINITGEVLFGVNDNVNLLFKTDGVVRFPNGSIRRNDSFAGIFLNVNPEYCYYYNQTDDCWTLQNLYGTYMRTNCFVYFDIRCDLSICGDGVEDSGEECDDGVGNTDTPCTPPYGSSCTYCDTSCDEFIISPTQWCDDNIVNGAEVCDNGTAQNGNACTPSPGVNCTWCSDDCMTVIEEEWAPAGFCGDGTIDTPLETCDNGTGVNTDTPCTPAYGMNCSYCDTTCQAINVTPTQWCGDGFMNGLETCDNATENGNVCTPPAYGNCTYCDVGCNEVVVNSPAYCGDGIPNGLEACDNGTGVNTDVPCSPPFAGACYSCSADCTSINREVDPDLLLWFPFDDTPGATLEDWSNYGRDGVISAPTWGTPDADTGAPGLGGGSYYFDGGPTQDDGRGDAYNLSSWNMNGDEVTISAWIRSDDYHHDGLETWQNGDARILSKADDYHTDSHIWMLSTISVGWPYDDAVARFRLKTGTPSSTTWQVIGSIVLTEGDWHHVAARYDGSGIELYVDGVYDGMNSSATGNIAQNAFQVRVGANPDPTAADGEDHRFWKGNIDNLQVFDRALTPSEIADLANP